MKNIFRIFLFSVCLSIGGLNAHAANLPGENPKEVALLSKITARVGEIQAMDKTSLSPSEKKELRKELQKMKKQADGLDRKVYLSVGAVIIIILLLILILR